MKTFHYYVTFICPGEPFNIHSIEVTTPSKIDTYESIMSMQKNIGVHLGIQSNSMVILNYKLIRDEPY